MNRKLLTIAASIVSMTMSVPAFSQGSDGPHFFNAGETFTATGVGHIGVECLASISGTIGPSLGLGAPHVDHAKKAYVSITNTGPWPCPAVAFEAVLKANGAVYLDGNSAADSTCGQTSQYYGSGAVAIWNNLTETEVSVSGLTYGSCSLSLDAVADRILWHP